MKTAALLPLVLALASCVTPEQAAPEPARDEPAPVAAPLPPPTPEADMPKEPNLYALTAPSLDGRPIDLATYRGKVALVVNVASECGFTKQYTGLEALWREYQGKGLVVLGFPSNEFGGQEPGDAAAIGAFCTKNFGVTFPLFAKAETKPGAGQSPVYSYLTTATGKTPNWNFCKYLVGKDGKVVTFWKSPVEPESAELRTALDAALAAK